MSGSSEMTETAEAGWMSLSFLMHSPRHSSLWVVTSYMVGNCPFVIREAWEETMKLLESDLISEHDLHHILRSDKSLTLDSGGDKLDTTYSWRE